jgi:hypothetical protein
MALSNAAQLAIINLLFENTAFANVGNAGGLLPSSLAGSWYIALHTADPTAAGTQSSNEATYTGYSRTPVARAGGSWTTSGTSPTQIVNAAIVNAPLCTGGSNTITYFSLGVASAGATVMLGSGTVTSLSVSNGITPSFAIGQLVFTLN